MGNLIVKLMVGFAAKLLTEKVFNKLLVEMMWAGAKKTENKIDDRLVAEVAKAVSVELPAKEVEEALKG